MQYTVIDSWKQYYDEHLNGSEDTREDQGNASRAGNEYKMRSNLDILISRILITKFYVSLYDLSVNITKRDNIIMYGK